MANWPNDIIWNEWTNESTSSTTTDIWSTWASSTDTSSGPSSGMTIYSGRVWYLWTTEEKQKNQKFNLEYEQQYVPNPYAQGPDLSQEQKEELRKERERRKKLEEEKAKAEEKAKQLLLDLIGPEQLKVYEETGRVFVKGNKHDYIVNKVGHVHMIEKNKVTDLCIHFQNRYKYPVTDNVVGLKLMIEGDEDNFLKTANNHGSREVKELPRAACM